MIALFALICASMVLVNIPTKKVGVQKGSKEKALVLSVDNSHIIHQGLIISGFQTLEVKVLSGEFKGQTLNASNILRAQMELDKVFEIGDLALVGISDGFNPQTDTINAQDHYRTNYTIWLFVLFGVLLILFGGITGVKALLSFVLTCLVIWKLEIPLCLRGWDPILLSFITVTVLTAIIIFMIAGVNRRGSTAFMGSIAGVGASCIMAIVFTDLFNINGATMPYSQALIYSGYEFLNLTDIYIGAIFLASSGAVMDLAMDVATGMEEVFLANPKVSRKNLILSGLRLGRSVVGTMTTTLLLAYSGGYLTLMMAYMAQGVTMVDFINNPYVASEVVRTIIGSFGLVLVAPFTALMGGLFMHKK